MGNFAANPVEFKVMQVPAFCTLKLATTLNIPMVSCSFTCLLSNCLYRDGMLLKIAIFWC